MTKQDKVYFAGLITAMAAGYGQEADRPMLLFYWLALRDLTKDQMASAVAQAGRKLKFMPRPAELLDLANVVSDEVADKLRAAEAWPELRKLLTRSSGDHSDPVAKEAIRLMGGARALACRDNAYLDEWGRKRFEELYLDLCDADRRRFLPCGDVRLGIHEHTKPDQPTHQECPSESENLIVPGSESKPEP